MIFVLMPTMLSGFQVNNFLNLCRRLVSVAFNPEDLSWLFNIDLFQVLHEDRATPLFSRVFIYVDI